MKRPAWLLGVVIAAALALPLRAAAAAAPQGCTDRPQCLEIVLRVPLDGNHAPHGTILGRQVRAAEVRISAVLDDLYRFHTLRVVRRVLDAGHRTARLTQLLVRTVRMVLEHVADDELRAPRSR